MAYEMIPKTQFGRAGMYGDAWPTEPCIAFTKHGITLNAKFLAMFGVHKGTGLVFFVDRENRRVGLKIATEQGDFVNAFTVHAGGKSKMASMVVTCGFLAKAFPDAVGKAFVARLNPGQRVIEVQL